MAFAQADLSSANCGNYNAFRTSSTYSNLMYYADKIYPSGIIKLNLAKSNEYGGVEDLYPLLGVETGNTFTQAMTIPSRFDNDKQYFRYQQFYNGIKVEGGGYTVAALMTGGGPGDPCAQAYMVSPYIISGINLNVSPTISKNNLDNILNSAVMKPGSTLTDADVQSELVITHNLLSNCAATLMWKATYFNGGPKISWINASTGQVAKTADGNIQINAPTEIYGTQTLIDNTVGGITSLSAPDGSVVGFDFRGFPDCRFRTSGNFTANLIPTTTAPAWTTALFPSAIYQSFHVATALRPAYHGIGIDFGVINVGCHCPEANAFSLGASTLATTFFVVGTDGVNSFGTFDAVGHELGHTYLNAFLDATTVGGGTLHEGISDMLGTYVESVASGTLDWVIGDDVAAIATAVHRDLQFPNANLDCFSTELTAATEVHDRCEALGHWFFLISQGNANITGLGINKSIRIVLESLNLMAMTDDYPQMRTATLAFADDEFGPCSVEALTIRKAWNAICVGPADYTDCFTIEGNPVVCEENNYLHLYIGGALNNTVYRWTFPIEWTVQGGPGNPQGNMYIGTNFLVTHFPTYDWYPRYFNIEVYCPALGSEYTQHKRVTIRDCDGDDPTCHEFYDLDGGGTPDDRSISGNELYNLPESIIKTLRVCDVMGRTLYTGEPTLFDRSTISNEGIIIIAYYDESGRLVKTEKSVLIRRE